MLVFPVIPLGSDGANELGHKYSFPGTFAIRAATLRALYMDLAAELGGQGFRWVFLMNGHGAPSHSRALFDACDFYREAYGHTMVHFCGLAPIVQWPGYKTPSGFGVKKRAARTDFWFMRTCWKQVGTCTSDPQQSDQRIVLRSRKQCLQ